MEVPGFITLPNGKHSRIVHVGSVQLTPTLMMSNVLHVPDFQFNLLSVHKLCEQIASKLIFSATDCTLQGPMLQEMVLGKASSGLYHIQRQAVPKIAAEQSSLVMLSGTQQVHNQPMLEENVILLELDSWHFRLGHLSFDEMRYVDFPYNNKRTNTICTVCPKARLHRQPFPLSNTKASRIFELVHVDIWGAYRCSTYDGYRYFLAIVDDYSRAIGYI